MGFGMSTDTNVGTLQTPSASECPQCSGHKEKNINNANSDFNAIIHSYIGIVT